MWRGFIVPAILSLFFISSACTEKEGANQQMVQEAAGGSDSTARNSASGDVAFIDSIVSHHQMGIHMAQMEVERGSRAEVKSMAQKIIDEQKQDISRLKTIRAQAAGSDSVMARMDMMSVPGMDSLMAARGQALDELFLRQMIAHHQGAVQMTRSMLPNISRRDLEQLANKMLTNQQQEVAQMQRMLDK